jgi:hypothetical protein
MTSGSLPKWLKRHVIRVPVRGGVEGSEVGLNEILSRIQIQNSSCILESDLSQWQRDTFLIPLDDTITLDMRKYVYLSVNPLTMRWNRMELSYRYKNLI